MKMKQVFQALSSFFRAERIEYALIGAFALHAHGHVRATRDIDLLVRYEHQDQIVRFLESLGYETLHRSRGFSNHLHPMAGLGRIDFVYVSGDSADSILGSARPMLFLGQSQIPVARPEHLIALKLFAIQNDPKRRFQDLADIERLMELPDLDRAEIEAYFKRYGQQELYHELTANQDPES